MASRIFTASYPGTCDECGCDIEPGDELQFMSTGELVHAECNTDEIGD